MRNKRLNRFVLLGLTLLAIQSPVIAQASTYAEHFPILGKESSVIISVFRAGALSVFGHNHVISSHDLSGTIRMVKAPSETGDFSLTLPLSSLEVDNESERKKMGKAFSTSVSESAKTGTRKHMLGAKVLNYPHYKKIVVSGKLVDHTVSAEISLHGTNQKIQVPVKISRSSTKLFVSGNFSIKQSDFGIKPYRAAAGLLKIKDTIEIRFFIVAAK